MTPSRVSARVVASRIEWIGAMLAGIRALPLDSLEAGRSTEEEATVMTNLDRIRKQLRPARRKKIAARVAVLIAEERSLPELRQAAAG